LADQLTPTGKKKQPSGAANRKRRNARLAAEREARVAMLRAQGRMADLQEVPVEWVPRPHQKLLKDAWERGVRWQAHVWHRRAGKTAACLDLLVSAAIKRPGNYWFLCPKLTQTRTAIWDSRRADGRREIDVHIPKDIRTRINEAMMLIELVNGSSIRFLGSDGFDRLVGANVHGIVFDEFALGDPAAWDYLAPILLADPNKEAWAVFISTYRGRNHWYRLANRVKDDPEWATSFLTIEDTVREDGERIITAEQIERERAQGKAEEFLRQEYYNDPLSGFDGSYYGAQMRQMQADGRLGPVLYDQKLPVTAAVDLGMSDEMVFTFWQENGGEERCIGSKSYKFTNLPDALDDIKLTFPWGKRPMTAVIPHDGRFGAGDVFERYGYDPLVLPRTASVAQEIEKVRAFLGRVRIDNAIRPWTDNEENNARLSEALIGYRTVRSKTDAEVYQKQAAHTWESHWADSVRYYVVYRDQYDAPGAWNRAPDYSLQDRAQAGVIRR
jgi:phage terminase large subunit